MTHTELRVGNWVRTCAPNMRIMIPSLDAQVEGIDFNGALIFRYELESTVAQKVRAMVLSLPRAIESFLMEPQHVVGIPLDKDWLERFGFRVREHSARIGSRKGGNGLLLTVPYDGALEGWRWLMDDGGDIPAIFDIRVKFVHQLQNLFFAITGQELTYDATKHQPDPGTPRP